MRKRLHLCWLAAGALGLAAGVVFLAGAQPTGAGKRDGKEKAETARVDAALDAWVHQLTERMTDRHDSIRQSARLALVAIGKPALPSLKKLAQGEDGASAEAAKKVIRRIESHGRLGSYNVRVGRWRHGQGRGLAFQGGRRGSFGRGFPGRGPAMQRGRGGFGPGALPGARPGLRGGFGPGAFPGARPGIRGGFGGGVAGPQGTRPGTQGGQGRGGRGAGSGPGGRGGFGTGPNGGAGFGGARGPGSPQEE
jgi:hypothetical protein